ncbi:MAG: tRNA pseudouridine(38-40) synthase TruA [Rickettsia endosymbiont of Ixodes persulcatus]|nr:tRNA pseudouridine(38-40) synthase TruA [Rickettsia endosymbiont of Ixodes persulcatus]
MRYKLTIEYDGTCFIGWQQQKESTNSIQHNIENAIFNFCGSSVTLQVGGRTDAGVHALGQVAHFDLEKDYKEYVVRDAINYHLRTLPISVIGVEKVTDEFHARFSAKCRKYRYRIINRYAPPALDRMKAWHIRKFLDVNYMSEASSHLLGHHDFSSFRSSECQANSPLRTLDEINIVRNGDEVDIYVSALSFLYNQVRIIVGTLVKFGHGSLFPSYMKEILLKCDRTKSGMTAPPYGLYLISIGY